MGLARGAGIFFSEIDIQVNGPSVHGQVCQDEDDHYCPVDGSDRVSAKFVKELQCNNFDDNLCSTNDD